LEQQQTLSSCNEGEAQRSMNEFRIWSQIVSHNNAHWVHPGCISRISTKLLFYLQDVVFSLQNIQCYYPASVIHIFKSI